MSKTSNCIKMLRILKTHGRINKSELANLLDTNPRNISEYVKELESAGYLVDVYSGKNGGYELRNDAFLPSFRLNEEELNAITQGIEYLRARNDFALKDELNLALSKILSDNKKLDYEEISIINRFPLKMPIEEIKKRLLTLQESIKTKCKVKIVYSSLENKSKTHILFPLKIFMFNNAWFVLALDDELNKILYFKLNRIEKINLLESKFRIPLYYKESDYLDEFGMKNNGNWYSLELKITGKSAVLIKERIYGRNQQIIDQDDGSIILKVEMQNEDDVDGFILKMKDSCEVLKKELIK